MALKDKVVKAGFYLVLANIISQFSSIVVNIVLARLLFPEDFGLIALATTIIGFIIMFTSIGFGSSIIYERKSTHTQLSSLYWLNYITSIFTFILVVLSANFGAKFYNEPKLLYVIWLSSLSILINPLFTIQYKLKERDIEFKLLTKINVSSTIIGSIAAIIGAFSGLGVYALVLQSLISNTTKMLLVLLKTEWRPSLIFKFKEIKHMVWYSAKFKLSSSILYLDRNIDYLILGKLFPASSLGYYAFSYNIMYTPVKKISGIFSDLLFPSFSAIKNDHSKIILGYFKSIQLISIISFPAMIILAFNAHLIITFVFGNKWDDAIPIVEVLCFAGAIQSIGQFGSVIFPSIGKPEIDIYFGVFRAILTVTAIITGSFYGILMVAYFLVFAKALSFFLFLLILNHHIPFSFLQLLNYLKGPIISVISLIALQLIFINYGVNIGEIVRLILMLFTALILMIIFHKQTMIDIYSILKKKTT